MVWGFLKYMNLGDVALNQLETCAYEHLYNYTSWNKILKQHLLKKLPKKNDVIF